jgi:outer membrane protein TolC
MKKYFLSMIFILMSCIGAQAQLTLDECHRLARANYPEIRQYDLVNLTRDYSVSSLGKAYLPQVSLSAQATLQSAVPEYPAVLKSMLTSQGIEMPGLKKGQYKVQAELSQLVWDGGLNAANVKMAQAQAEAETKSADVDLYALEERINDLYFGVLLLDEQISRIGHTIALLQTNLAKMNSLVRNGAAMTSDADAVEADMLYMKQQLTQSEAYRAGYLKVLSLFVGKDISGNAFEKPSDSVPASFSSARPELGYFDAKAEEFSAQEKAVKASTAPSFGFFAQGYYGYPGLDYFKSMMDTGSSFNGLLGVRMYWNIGSFYTRKNSLDKIRTAKSRIEVQRDVFVFNNNLLAVQENDDISRLRKELSDDDRIVELRKRIREAAESRLENGVIDSADLLVKITEENNALIARSSREIELLKAVYELKHTVNQ